MNEALLFKLANALSLLSWVMLIAFPLKNWAKKLVFSGSILIFCIAYLILLGMGIQNLDFQSFGSLEGVKSLFGEDRTVLIGWLHYLAFDLMVGLYILNNAQKNQIAHLLIIPCLLLCFMFGPVGLLCYLVLRLAKGKGVNY